jgi:hypothetical protein
MVVLWGYCRTFKELPATTKYHLFTIPNFITLMKVKFFPQKFLQCRVKLVQIIELNPMSTDLDCTPKYREHQSKVVPANHIKLS